MQVLILAFKLRNTWKSIYVINGECCVHDISMTYYSCYCFKKHTFFVIKSIYNKVFCIHSTAISVPFMQDTHMNDPGNIILSLLTYSQRIPYTISSYHNTWDNAHNHGRMLSRARPGAILWYRLLFSRLTVSIKLSTNILYAQYLPKWLYNLKMIDIKR